MKADSQFSHCSGNCPTIFNKRQIQSRAGFSLLELAVVLAVVSVLALGAIFACAQGQGLVGAAKRVVPGWNGECLATQSSAQALARGDFDGVDGASKTFIAPAAEAGKNGIEETPDDTEETFSATGPTSRSWALRHSWTLLFGLIVVGWEFASRFSCARVAQRSFRS